MDQIAFLIKPASSSCNLACSYCFYNDVSDQRQHFNYGIMSKTTTKNLIQKACDYVKDSGRITFSFQGGEPMVATLAYFEQFVALVQEIKTKQQIIYALQTNATLIDDAWASFFRKHQFLIGVSLDGYEKNMDQFRYDAKKKGVYYQVLRGINFLKKHQVEFNILTVVSASLAKHPKALYQYYKNNHYRHVQLIPCLPSLKGNQPMDKHALTYELYSEFFIQFFDCWIKDVGTKDFIEVNLFMNLLEMLQGRPPYQCGMIGRCFVQYVVEGDGSLFPCDFYVLDDLKMGNINVDSIEELRQSNAAQDFLKDDNFMKKPCEQCPFIRMCFGGCKRQNSCYLSDEACGYQEFLKHAIQKLDQIKYR